VSRSEQHRWYGPWGGLRPFLLFLIAGSVALAAGAIVFATHPRRRVHASKRSRDELAEEHVALRHIATLVARGAPPPEVFAAVAEETGRLLRADITHMVRYEPAGEGTWWRRGATGLEGCPSALATRSKEGTSRRR
jgi:hypothetical protein